METSYDEVHKGATEKSKKIMSHSCYWSQRAKTLLYPSLDLKVFYVRICKCEIDDSAPENLTLNYTPLNPRTFLQVNGVARSFYTTLLRCNRLDKKSKEATFVSTNGMRMTGSLKFEVFSEDLLVLSGYLLLSVEDNSDGEKKGSGLEWRMSCESHVGSSTAFFAGKQCMGHHDSSSPYVEVCIAGSISGSPTILTKTLKPSFQKGQMGKLMPDTVPELEGANCLKAFPSRLALEMPGEHQNYCLELENNIYHYKGSELLDGEESEVSWFHAGVKAGIGISLTICLGIGIGVGLLIQTYRGAASNFRSRLS